MARSDAKLKTLPENIQAEMWRMRTTPVDAEGRECAPDKGRAMTQGEVLEWLEDVHRVSSSAGAFSDWERWYAVQRTVGNTKQQTLDLMEALRAKHPEATEDEIMRMGQVWFSLQSMEHGDAKVFEAMYRLRLKERDQANEDRRIRLLEETAARVKAELTAVVKESKGGLTEETLKRIEEAANLL